MLGKRVSVVMLLLPLQSGRHWSVLASGVVDVGAGPPLRKGSRGAWGRVSRGREVRQPAVLTAGRGSAYSKV